MTMRVYVDDRPVDLAPRLTIRHALLAAGVLDRVDEACRPRDSWGNELGLDGSLNEGMRIYLR
jgi:hypothetical protein